MCSREITGPGGAKQPERPPELNPNAELGRYCRKLLTMMEFAKLMSYLSTDPRVEVGCVVFPLDCSAVLGMGYCGVARGLPHDEIDSGKPLLLGGPSGAAHAEANALVKMDTATAPACLMAVTAPPCPYCAPLIINSRCIVGVIYADNLDLPLETSGVGILERCEITVVRDGLLLHLDDDKHLEVTDVVRQWKECS